MDRESKSMFTFLQKDKHTTKSGKNASSSFFLKRLKEAARKWGTAWAIAAALTGASLFGASEARGELVGVYNNFVDNPSLQGSIERSVSYWNELLPGSEARSVTFSMEPISHFNNNPNVIGHSHGNEARICYSTAWDFSAAPVTQVVTSENSSGMNLEAIATHELGHQYGISSNREAITIPDDDPGNPIAFDPNVARITLVGWGELSTFDQHLMYADNDSVEYESIQENTWYFYDQQGASFVFSGESANEVFNDGGEVKQYVPVENMCSFQYGSSLAHTSTDFGVMNWASGLSNRGFFSEAELAVINDIRRDEDLSLINLRDHFGRSIYTTHSETVNNTAGFNSSAMFGVGLHVVADGNTVVQKANLSANGSGAAGIRIEGLNNNVTIDSDIDVSANGQNGMGVVITSASNAYLNNKGSIQAIGAGGIGVCFDTAITIPKSGKNVYFGSAKQFDNTGTIEAETAINFRAEEKYQEYSELYSKNCIKVNFMSNSQVVGDIVSDKLARGVLTFGKMADGNGAATSVGDSRFSMTYDGLIDGYGKIDLEVWGGSVRLTSGNNNFSNGIIGLGEVDSALIVEN